MISPPKNQYPQTMSSSTSCTLEHIICLIFLLVVSLGNIKMNASSLTHCHLKASGPETGWVSRSNQYEVRKVDEAESQNNQQVA